MDSASDPTPSHPAHALLARAHSPTTAASLFTAKVLHKPLILRPTSPDPTAHDARAARRTHRLHVAAHKRSRQRPKPLSARERRLLGVHDIPKSQQRYALYEGLHKLWVGYVWEVLGLVDREGKARRGVRLGPEEAGPKMAAADWHGAEVQVVRCGCVGRVGARGIVVKDTKFTLVVVTRGDRLLSESPGMRYYCAAHECIAIPKKDTVFRVEVPRPVDAEGGERKDVGHLKVDAAEEAPKVTFELNGTEFQCKATDRATKKFKEHRNKL